MLMFSVREYWGCFFGLFFCVLSLVECSVWLVVVLFWGSCFSGT